MMNISNKWLISAVLVSISSKTMAFISPLSMKKHHLARNTYKSFLKSSSDDVYFSFGDEEEDDEGDVVLFSSEWEDGVAPTEEPEQPSYKKTNRWHSLSPAVKERIIKEQQAKAIANKKKREPAKDKKRRKFHFPLETIFIFLYLYLMYFAYIYILLIIIMIYI